MIHDVVLLEGVFPSVAAILAMQPQRVLQRSEVNGLSSAVSLLEAGG